MLRGRHLIFLGKSYGRIHLTPYSSTRTPIFLQLTTDSIFPVYLAVSIVPVSTNSFAVLLYLAISFFPFDVGVMELSLLSALSKSRLCFQGRMSKCRVSKWATVMISILHSECASLVHRIDNVMDEKGMAVMLSSSEARFQALQYLNCPPPFSAETRGDSCSAVYHSCHYPA